jgi:hypothetical protein
LSSIKIDVPVPNLSLPADGDDDNEGDDPPDRPQFIKDATVRALMLLLLWKIFEFPQKLTGLM